MPADGETGHPVVAMQPQPNKKLRLPVTLAVVALASAGCGGTTPQPNDAGSDSAVVVADTGPLDANCTWPAVYNPDTMMCELIT